MAQAALLTKLTYEDFLGFPEDGRRHELIDGDHYVSPSPNTKHQRLVLNLAAALVGFTRPRSLGQVFCAPMDVVLSDFDVVEPDVLFVARERLSIITEDNLIAAPDLMVEVLSDSTRRRDEITKRHLYERFGVREYWVVDPQIDVVKVYRLEGERLLKKEELSLEERGTLTTPLLPGLEIPVERIFE